MSIPLLEITDPIDRLERTRRLLLQNAYNARSVGLHELANNLGCLGDALKLTLDELKDEMEAA